MAETRKGRQIPTQSVVMPYETTYGNEAVDLYNSTGRTAQEWQELMMYDILAYNEDGLWVHTKAGYSVPRRNGKNEILVMREIWGLSCSCAREQYRWQQTCAQPVLFFIIFDLINGSIQKLKYALCKWGLSDIIYT